MCPAIQSFIELCVRGPPSCRMTCHLTCPFPSPPIESDWLLTDNASTWSGSPADRGWKFLRQALSRYDNATTDYRYTKAVMETVLSVDRSTPPPPWLVQTLEVGLATHYPALESHPLLIGPASGIPDPSRLEVRKDRGCSLILACYASQGLFPHSAVTDVDG